VTLAGLLVLAAAVALVSFLLRLAYEYGGDEYLIDLNAYQWPQCLALFGLGVIGAPQGCSTPSRTGCAGSAGPPPLSLWQAWRSVRSWRPGPALGRSPRTAGGGLNVDALAFVTLESTATVAGPVSLLGEAQRDLARSLPWIRPAATRSAYGAFIVQGLVLIGLAATLRRCRCRCQPRPRRSSSRSAA